MSIYWPIFLVVGSNVFYHICAKLTPKGIHPLMAVIVTYLTGTVIVSLLYMYMTKGTERAVNLRKRLSNTRRLVCSRLYSRYGLGRRARCVTCKNA